MGSGFELQLHDFNPGITPSGLFWTARIDEDAIAVAPGSGDAHLQVTNLPLVDAHDVVNALLHGPTIPAVASFDVRWHGGGDRRLVRNTDQDYAGEFVDGTATVAWAAANAAGFSFVSAPAATSESHFATVGRERNGVFF